MLPATGLLAMLFIAGCALAGVPGLSPFSGFAYSTMAFTGLVVARARRRAEREEDAAG